METPAFRIRDALGRIRPGSSRSQQIRCSRFYPGSDRILAPCSPTGFHHRSSKTNGGSFGLDHRQLPYVVQSTTFLWCRALLGDTSDRLVQPTSSVFKDGHPLPVGSPFKEAQVDFHRSGLGHRTPCARRTIYLRAHPRASGPPSPCGWGAVRLRRPTPAVTPSPRCAAATAAPHGPEPACPLSPPCSSKWGSHYQG